MEKLMSELESQTKQVNYQIVMIVLETKERKNVPTHSDKSYEQLLEYCNDLNEYADTYGTVYYLSTS
jgi:hypothetical protein